MAQIFVSPGDAQEALDKARPGDIEEYRKD